MEMKDKVSHPVYYTQGGIECIDALAAATINLRGLEAVCTANAIKYLWRWKSKNGVEDLRKAKWYIDRLISGCKNVDFYVSAWHKDKRAMPKDCYIIAKLHHIAEPVLCHVDDGGSISSTYDWEAVNLYEIERWCSIDLNL